MQGTQRTWSSWHGLQKERYYNSERNVRPASKNILDVRFHISVHFLLPCSLDTLTVSLKIDVNSQNVNHQSWLQQLETRLYANVCLLCYGYQIFVGWYYIGKSDYPHITFWQRNLPVMYMLVVTWSEWRLETSLASLPCTKLCMYRKFSWL